MAKTKIPVPCPGCGTMMERTSGKSYSASDRDSWYICPECGGCGRLRTQVIQRREWIDWQKPLQVEAGEEARVGERAIGHVAQQ